MYRGRLLEQEPKHLQEMKSEMNWIYLSATDASQIM